MNEIKEVKEVLSGGCKWIQLRMKNAPDEDVITTGKEIGALCREAGATFIIDDRVDLVETFNANGVHLGKNDMPLPEARKILGSEKIIGATANSLEDALKAVKEGADYLGIGPFRFTTTKEKLSPVLGLEGFSSLMRELRKVSNIPVVAIGGIGEEDIDGIMATGVTGIAVSGNIINSFSPKDKTEKILKQLSLWIN